MAATCYFSGRLGNIFYSTAMLLAYCKKHSLPYHIPPEADAYKHFTGGKNINPIPIPSTGQKPLNPKRYREPHDRGDRQPYYHQISKMDNVLFDGYWQSFFYIDWCRDYILETFNFPYSMKQGITSVSVRRGDCVNSPHFPIAPRGYYQNAIRYMQDKGYSKFLVFSDDQNWCKEEFVKENYSDAEIEFFDGGEIDSYLGIQSCENNITARSTFSLSAAWINRNPNKIVLVPTLRHRYWKCQNLDLIPSYFTQIDFDE